MSKAHESYEGPRLNLKCEDDFECELTWHNSMIRAYADWRFNCLHHVTPEGDSYLIVQERFLEIKDILHQNHFPATFHPDLRQAKIFWGDYFEAFGLFQRIHLLPFCQQQPDLEICLLDNNETIALGWHNTRLRFFKDPQYDHILYFNTNLEAAIIWNEEVMEMLTDKDYPCTYRPEVDGFTKQKFDQRSLLEIQVAPEEDIVRRILDSGEESWI